MDLDKLIFGRCVLSVVVHELFFFMKRLTYLLKHVKAFVQLTCQSTQL